MQILLVIMSVLVDSITFFFTKVRIAGNSFFAAGDPGCLSGVGRLWH